MALLAVLALALATLVTASVTPRATGLILSALVFELGLAGFSLLWVAVRHRQKPAALGLASEHLARDTIVGAASGVALFFFVVLLVAPALFALFGALSGGRVEAPRQEVLPADPASAQILIGGIVVVLGAPFGEEVFFRGFLFGALRRRFRFAGAATMSAAAFAAFHVLPLLMPLMFVVGLGLAYVYERTGSLFGAIAAHAAFNLIGFSFIVRSLT